MKKEFQEKQLQLKTDCLEAQLALLEETESHYRDCPSLLDLGIFVGLLVVEATTAFYLVYAGSRDLVKAAATATFPVVITAAAAAYQAREYDIPKEHQKLIEAYEEYLDDDAN